MSRSIKTILQNTINTVPQLFRYMLAIGLALVISLYFPNNLHFNKDFRVGGIWEHENLVSLFDFPIKKTEAEKSQERQKFEAEFIPYYRLDTGFHSQQKFLFLSRFATVYQNDSNLTGKIDSAAFAEFGQTTIDSIYAKGLLELIPEHKAADQDEFIFELLVGNGNFSQGEHSPDDFLSPRRASEILIDTLSTVEGELAQTRVLFDLLENIIIMPNITYDEELTEKKKHSILETIEAGQGMVHVGEQIVSRQQKIDSVVYLKLKSYQDVYEKELNAKKNDGLIYLGYLLLTIALLIIFVLLVRLYAREVYGNLRHFSLLLLLIGLYTYVAYIIHGIPLLADLYLVPFCIVPIVIQNFFGARLALFVHLVIILLSSMLLSLDYQFILVQIIVGLVVIVTQLQTRYLSAFFSSMLYIALAYSAAFLSLEIANTGSLVPIEGANGEILRQIRWENLGWIGLNVFFTMLSYPLIPLLERVFGLTSEITLVELSDLNNPLLKEMSIKAPGTLQHSLQVANLSEAAASEIGANALLLKVAALYHDIGKTLNPTYFIENQNDYNPHQDLTYLESAQMILSHVTEGAKLAKKHRLPNILIDFIVSHHGTTRVEFFYRMHQKENPDQEVDPKLFQYPGPRPQSREQAILMIADSLEAASKSLKNPTGADIDNLTEKIIAYKIEHRQLEETDLSFKELEQIKGVFKKLLRSIHHVRISYPDEKLTAKTKELGEKAEGSDTETEKDALLKIEVQRKDEIEKEEKENETPKADEDEVNDNVE